MIFTDRTTLLVMLSALIAALLTIFPATAKLFPFWVMAAGARIGDTLFHELGHALFAWFFGKPSIPMLFTLFGADQAGGMAMTWDRSWIMQILAYAGLAYGCWWLRDVSERLFIPAVVFTLLVVAVSFTGYHDAVISYMGHGGSIAMGGYLLFRGWIYLDARNQFERWLNGFFGFFLTLFNFHFAWKLVFHDITRQVYSEHTAFGISHNDFVAMTEVVYSWSVSGIAVFTMIYCVAVIIASAVLAQVASDGF